MVRVVVRNKMGYPIRVLKEIDSANRYTYTKIAGKTTVGPMMVSERVHIIISQDPSVEVTIR